jgi:DDE superfamily endonuclease
MPKGEQVEVLTPGTNEKRSLAGALDMQTGTIVHRVWWRKTPGRFLDLLQTLDRTYPVAQFSQLSVVVDNYQIHKAQAVEHWLAAPPRFELLFLPTYCPKASPIERAFGDVHDKCTRNHKRKGLWMLVRDVEQHLSINGPWRYELSEIYYTPDVTAAVQALLATQAALQETSQLAA